MSYYGRRRMQEALSPTGIIQNRQQMSIREEKINVIFCECGRNGGSVKRLINLIKRIDRNRFCPSIFSYYEDGKASKLIGFGKEMPVFSLGVKNSSIPDVIKRTCCIQYPTFFSVIYFFKALIAIFKVNPDIVYVNNTPYSHLPIFFIAKIFKKKIICHLRDTVKLTRLELTVLSWARFVVVLSEAHAEFYKNQGISQEKIKVIYNGIDLEEFDHQMEECIIRSKQKDFVAFVSVLSARKRWLDVIKAADLLRDDMPSLVFLILGDGEDRPLLQQEIEQRNLQSSVKFLGFVPNVAPYLRASKLGLMVSDREGMPNVILEYMAAGLPVISTDLLGINEMIKHRINGLIIPPGRPDILAGSIKELLHNEMLRSQMGRSSRKILERGRFTVKSEIQGIEDLIDNA